MKAICLASSSAGNCYFLIIETGSRTATIMVECGIRPRAILQGMTENGIGIADVDACLVTHHHGDHSLAMQSVADWGIPIFTHAETLKRWGVEGNALEELKPMKICEGVAVLPFPVKHDAEGSLGFVIKTRAETVVFVNDCKYWETDLSRFRPNYVFIECNYWEKQIYAQIAELHRVLADGGLSGDEKRSVGAKIRQFERNVDAHMSLAGCLRSLKKLDLSKCVAIFLMHLSDANANEYVMKEEVEKATGVKTLVCKKRGGIK